MKIFKWNLQIVDFQEIEMPIGAQILSMQIQNENPQLWALVDEKNATEKRSFITCGTGQEIPEDVGDYIGTYQIENGSLVFHVFEQITEQQKQNLMLKVSKT